MGIAGGHPRAGETSSLKSIMMVADCQWQRDPSLGDEGDEDRAALIRADNEEEAGHFRVSGRQGGTLTEAARTPLKIQIWDDLDINTN